MDTSPRFGKSRGSRILGGRDGGNPGESQLVQDVVSDPQASRGLAAWCAASSWRWTSTILSRGTSTAHPSESIQT
jgi:hypothetical protein